MKGENKPKGKPLEIMGKYELLARDATSAGDKNSSGKLHATC